MYCMTGHQYELKYRYLKLYWSFRDELAIIDGINMKVKEH